MTISITPLMHNTIADSVFGDILSKSSKYYYFLGKTVPYVTIGGGIEQVETPLPTYSYELSTRRDIITLKEITNNDVSFVIPRINWEADEIYDHYDDTYSEDFPTFSGATSITNARFYVLTDEFNLYICLDNNNEALSTVKPTGYDTTPIVTADGYKWKFVMNIPLALRVKFLTSFYIPITTAINSIFYNNGAIDTITIDNPGSGYPANTTASITVTSATTAMGSLVVGRNYIINSLGSTTNTQWNTIAGTTGVIYSIGSTLTAAIVGTGLGTGNVKGTGAILVPRVSTVDGSITRVDITSGGTGYVSGTTLTVVGTGTGMFSPNVTAILTPVIVAGVISYVTIVDPGQDYNVNNTTLTVQSDTGVDAQLSAIVSSGQIVDVIIDNPGSGYKAANVSAFGTGGSGAQFTVSTSGGRLETIQANVELLAVNGSIDYIHIDNPGEGYTAINVTIEGDGQNATATATILYGRLHKINITNRGSGYTFATVTLTAIISTPTELASARAVMCPYLGHGKNAITDLFSNTLMLYNTIDKENTSGFSFNNDYRQFGIIKNPIQYDSTLLFTEKTGTSCYVVTGTVNNGPLVTDMNLVDTNGNNYTVIALTVLYGSTVEVLLQPNDNSTPTTGQVLTSGITTYALSSITAPTIDKYSGDMIYIDNRAAFYQTEDQTVTLQTVLRF